MLKVEDLQRALDSQKEFEKLMYCHFGRDSETGEIVQIHPDKVVLVVDCSNK